MRSCPKCGSTVVYPEPITNPFHAWRARRTKKARYKCFACGWQGWGERPVSHRQEHGATANVSDNPDPDLGSLDDALGKKDDE